MTKRYNVLTRCLAAVALLFVYVASSSAILLGATTTPAQAQWRGRGWGYRGGWGLSRRLASRPWLLSPRLRFLPARSPLLVDPARRSRLPVVTTSGPAQTKPTTRHQVRRFRRT
ncbi:hypothetical protein MTX20_29500 [Bradyrhizobium sp. ISRA435]|nr:hypothetical protein MTX20_29500 [Bradyrhizobium sp. ISRA435]